MDIKEMILNHIEELDKQSKSMANGAHERMMALVSKTEALKTLVILEGQNKGSVGGQNED